MDWFFINTDIKDLKCDLTASVLQLVGWKDTLLIRGARVGITTPNICQLDVGLLLQSNTLNYAGQPL